MNVTSVGVVLFFCGLLLMAKAWFGHKEEKGEVMHCACCGRTNAMPIKLNGRTKGLIGRLGLKDTDSLCDDCIPVIHWVMEKQAEMEKRRWDQELDDRR